MWVCFWAHCSVPFIRVSVLSLVPCCFGCCISMVSLKSSNVSFLSLVFSHFSHNIVMTILSRILTGIAVNMQTKLGRGDVLIIVNLPVHIFGLSLYLLLWFLISEFCNFPNIDLIHILLDLCLFQFVQIVYKWWYVFIQVSIVYCWYVRKRLTFIY